MIKSRLLIGYEFGQPRTEISSEPTFKNDPKATKEKFNHKFKTK